MRRIIIPAIIGISMPFLIVSAVSAAVKHTVSPGETLGFIALMYHTGVSELANFNGIANPDLIFPGQELDVPGSDGGGGAPGGSYTVQSGDTLSGIAYAHDVTTSELASTNGLSDADYIYIGQVLTIPGPSQAAAPAVPKLVFPDRPYDETVEWAIDEIAYEEGIPAGLVKAIATVESGWRQWAISHAGAIGVMQVMPGTAVWLENDYFGYDLNEYDSIWDNVKLGARFLHILLEATGWDYYATAASYYQGLSPTEQGVYYPDTADYASMVLAVWQAYWP
ncbi:MAG TPA: LysM peptidoglycan-binding domain-containing protein [Dehalococcoidia bacterium]|nr:LysM peptidoglycan-binding domain-containing protein [Dehalococcoidia bacterium]